jgi:hypothetical protein
MTPVHHFIDGDHLFANTSVPLDFTRIVAGQILKIIFRSAGVAYHLIQPCNENPGETALRKIIQH